MLISSVKFPKKTLTSRKWHRRNDSSTISELLKSPEELPASTNSFDSASDTEEQKPRRLILSEPQACSILKDHKIVKTFCPECYCKSFPVVPSMGNRPRDSCCCQKQKTSNPRVQSAPVFLTNKTPKARFLDEEKSGKYTKRREYYENKTKDYFLTIRKRLDELEEELRQEQQEIEKSKKQHACRDLELKKKMKIPKACCRDCCPFKDDKIKDLLKFRKSHYFACHASTTSLGTSDTNFDGFDHCEDCVHRCRLDDRMKLEPEYYDEYGTSRCSNCEKALSEETSSAPTIDSRSVIFASGGSIFEDLNLLDLDNDEDTTVKIEKKVKGKDAVDKMILTTHNNEKLEVTVPANFLKESQKPLSMVTTTKNFKNFKMPVPANSMALRFQKGMIHKAFNPRSLSRSQF